jgi:hypothetical protein
MRAQRKLTGKETGVSKWRQKTTRKTTKDIHGAQDALPEFSDAQRDYLLSDAGIEHIMRTLSDGYENWRDCPVKRCRRARCCQGPDMVCQLPVPRLNAPPDEIARVNARMRQIVMRRLERFGVW